jgi:hypothetical protein
VQETADGVLIIAAAISARDSACDLLRAGLCGRLALLL